MAIINRRVHGRNQSLPAVGKATFWFDAADKRVVEPFDEITRTRASFVNAASYGTQYPFEAIDHDGVDDRTTFSSFSVVPSGTTKLASFVRFYCDVAPGSGDVDYFVSMPDTANGWYTHNIGYYNNSGTHTLLHVFQNNPDFPNTQYTTIEAGRWYDALWRWERSAGTSADVRLWVDGVEVSPTFAANGYDTSTTLHGHDEWGFGCLHPTTSGKANFFDGKVASLGLWVGDDLPSVSECARLAKAKAAESSSARYASMFFEPVPAATGGGRLALLGVGA